MGKELAKYENKDDISQAAITYKQDVENLKITSRETYGQMVNLMLDAKRFIKAVKEIFEKHRLRTKAAYDGVLEDIRKYSKPFQEAERIAKQRIGGWEQIEAERKRKAEAKQREAIAATEAKQKIAEEEAAARNESPPAFVPPPIARPIENYAKVDGVTFQDHWVGTILDLKALCRAIANEKAPPDFIKIEQGVINRFGQSCKGHVSIPGIIWKNEKIVKGSV